MKAAGAKAIVQAKDLTKRFPVRGGLFQRAKRWVTAVDHVSLSVLPGTTLGLVGESGCGKTTVGRLMLALLGADGGEVIFEDRPLKQWLSQDRLTMRRRMQIVFQDPLDSLDPRFSIGQSIAEPLLATRACPRSEAADRVRDALLEVQLPPEIAASYPHELSGGQRQRVGIARAMVVKPAFVVCDEPVSSLDLSIQGQVLDLLKQLQEKHGIAYLFISHDLGVIDAMSQQVAVMYLGAIVEVAPTEELMKRPWHPYTEALLAAVPRPDPEHPMDVKPLQGDPPSPIERPSGCRFRTRCPLAQERCAREEPLLEEKAPGRWVACHFRP